MNRGVNALVWAMNARGISPTAFRLLVILCGYVNGSDAKRSDYDVWPSKTDLAEKCEISISGVKRHLKELCEAGYIEVAQWQTDSGSTTTNTYTICVGSEHQMPGGVVVRSGKPVGVQSDPPVQSDPGGRGSGLTPGGFTAEPCREPSNRTIESPLSLTGEAPPADLLGDLIEQGETRGSLIDYVADRWSTLAQDYPRIPTVRVWNDARKRAIARRADEVVRASGGAVDAYQVWDQIFAAIRADPWLRGDSNPGRGHDRAFVVEIDHVIRPTGNPNFLRILEKAPTNEQDHDASSDPVTGRRYGPAELATRAAIARLRAAD